MQTALRRPQTGGFIKNKQIKKTKPKTKPTAFRFKKKKIKCFNLVCIK